MKDLQNFIATENYVNTFYESPVFNNGEFDYKILIEVINLDEAIGELGYGVICGVSKLPAFLPVEKVKDIKETFCIEEITVSEIFEYGVYAKLGDAHALNMEELEKAIAKFDKQVPLYNSLFGFYMDKYQNRLGNTGWDFLNGKVN